MQCIRCLNEEKKYFYNDQPQMKTIAKSKWH